VRPNPSSQFGLINPRVCLAFLLCTIGALLGMASFAVPTPPRGTLPVKGMIPAEAALASVTLTEFSDFECSYCKRAASVVEQVRQTYGRRVKVDFKQMQVSIPPTLTLAT